MLQTHYVPTRPIARLILAHGAGAGSQHDFMQALAKALYQLNIEVRLIDFPYMQLMNETGNRRPPNKLAILIDYFLAQVAEWCCDDVPLFIAGKSMGGRVATHLNCVSDDIKGVIVFGYPFHPPGKPDKLRVEHLAEMKRPCLILQGERDTFGNTGDVARYTLPNLCSVQWLIDGDHSLKPRVKSGFTQSQHIITAAKHTYEFITQYR